MCGMENGETSSEIQKIDADDIIQNVTRLFTVSHGIEMIGIERGR